ncbi:TraI/MobA(P) family conjugative relaxase [Pseudomonas savastanoi]|uniref:TraI/MobA(P) family conjugative relaxase n=1 Tax=Pseudomonas savastanoi TaxID=29438 RepID=UPI0006E53AC5|nr:TraI/MobA(P) family conjugative relaxase [Pseudomonas savastanoi]KPX37852.1 Relaxase/mobilization nuclease domain-containing protein [Pseudomonas savastanoi pv. glycinea]RMQ16035.1 Relaxase/mobilization nuclease domain-containing protein [Pseudomonas savastanoi pv. glycinea]RMQ47465.1 Relaxase/mobilization nuclease domain-containing protein [Pseudomonas savastanoi pv. glycinea]
MAVRTNCLSEDTAWIEMWGTSVRSKRTKDPVMHLVLSWSEGEWPTDDQAFDAGNFALAAIGLEGHEYLSAVHRDTNNAHLHIMVNKVHPDTHRVPKMSYSKFTLDKAMRQIEIDQGWKHDNGPFSVKEIDGKKSIDWTYTSAANRLQARGGTRADLPEKARQFEVHSGNESLASYAKGQPKDDARALMESAKASWQALHTILATHGLELRPVNDRTNAFYVASVSDPAQAPIKASDMGLGGGKLIKQLGPYEPLETRYFDREAFETQKYSKHRPLRDPTKRPENREKRAKERAELRGRYEGFVVEWKAMKAPAKAELVNSQKLRRKALTDLLRAEREDIRRSGLDGSHRRALLSVAAFIAAAKRDELKVIFKAENSSLRKEKLPSYREWVANYAEAGDPAAIAQLRGFSYADKRKGKHPQEPDVADVQRPSFAATSDRDLDPAPPARLSERVTWAVDRSTGVVNYSVNDRLAFRDEGRRLTFNKDSRNDADSIEVGLLLAKEKFGAVAIYGGQEFRDRVLATAVERRLNIRFADPELEQRRKDAIKAGIDQKHRRFVEDRKQVDAIRVQHEAKKAPQQPAMTLDEAQQALSARPPVRPVRDYIEMNAVEDDLAQYRSKLDRTHRESWGERPEPEKAGGFIGRHMAKGKAMQWDIDFNKNVERPSEARREHLNSDDPDAVEFRDTAWNQAIKAHDSSVNDWIEVHDYARQALMNTNVDSEPAALRQDDELTARQAEAQLQEEQERERQKSLNQDMPDLDM